MTATPLPVTPVATRAAPATEPAAPAVTPNALPDVRSLLPHRGSFLLVDRVLEWDAARIRCLKNVTATDPHLQGHFPDDPIFPGVLLIEACAQAGGILLGLSGRFSTRGYLAEVCDFKFLARVVPGDAVELHAEFASAVGSFARARVHATVAGRTVARGVVSYFFARG